MTARFWVSLSLLLLSATSLAYDSLPTPADIDVQENGVLKGTRPAVNFVSGATVTDDAANDRVNVTVSGGAGGGVTGPATTTVNAMPLWGDTAGGSILNSPMLLNSAAWTPGQTATFVLPGAGAFNRTYSLPNVDGTFFVSGGGQTLTTSFMAESLTWFNNADTSKRMTFDISNVPTSTTVAIRAPKTSGRMVIDTNTAAINNGNVVVNSSSVTTGKTATLLFSNSTDQTYSFPSTGGTVMMAGSTNVLGNTRITGWLALDNYVDITDYNAVNGFDPATPAGLDLRVWQKGEDLYITKDSGTQVNVSGTVAETRGGTNQTSYALGDLLYSSASNTLSKLAGNTTTTKKMLTQTGNGTISAAPAWGTLSTTDISEGTNLYYTNARAIAAPGMRLEPARSPLPTPSSRGSRSSTGMTTRGVRATRPSWRLRAAIPLRRLPAPMPLGMETRSRSQERELSTRSRQSTSTQPITRP
jgi:hypothetical protein